LSCSGEDGSRTDRIEGAEFEYDQKIGKATAAGPVEITLMRPGVARRLRPSRFRKRRGRKGKTTPIASVAATADRGEIHVKTSGLTFDTPTSGITTTNEHVDFPWSKAVAVPWAPIRLQARLLVLDHCG